MSSKVYGSTIAARNVYYAAAIPYVDINKVRLLVVPDKMVALNLLYNNPTATTLDQAGMRCSGYVQNIEKPAKSGAISKLVTAIIPG